MEDCFPSRRDKAYFKAAEAISKLSDHRCQIGCIIVNKHHIISSGNNTQHKTHAFQTKIDSKFFNCNCIGYLHAETDALIPLIKNNTDLSRATVYVFRKNRNNELALARPCPRCMSVIKSCGIKRLKYTTENGYAQETLLY